MQQVFEHCNMDSALTKRDVSTYNCLQMICIYAAIVETASDDKMLDKNNF